MVKYTMLSSRKNLVKKLHYARRSLMRVQNTYTKLRTNFNVVSNLMRIGNVDVNSYMGRQAKTLNQKAFKHYLKLHDYHHKLHAAIADLQDYDDVIHYAGKLNM